MREDGRNLGPVLVNISGVRLAILQLERRDYCWWGRTIRMMGRWGDTVKR
jgi:hypothetical protein